MRACYRFVPVVLLGLLGACSDSKLPQKAAQPAKPPELLTGRQAFQRIYPQARGWATDVQPLRVRSLQLAQLKPGPGKAGAWEVTFVSPSKASSRTYTFSSIEAEGNLHEGVFAAPIESYSGRGPAVPFLLAALQTDSEKAYEIAAEKSQDYIKKHPDMPISYLLEQTNRFPELTWRVIWGASASTSDYSVFVDATSGKFIEKAH